MAKATMFSAAVAAITLSAAPVAAQITVDDVWASQGALLSLAGVTQTGTLTRDGNVVTISASGGIYRMPFDAGHISWRLGDFVMTEADGAVSVDIGFALPLSLSVEMADVYLTIDATLTPQGLVRRFEGTPDHIVTITTADRLMVEMTDFRVRGIPDFGDIAIDAMVVAEGVDQRSELIGSGPYTRIDHSETARLITDIIYSDREVRSRDVSETRDTEYSSTITLPAEPLDFLNLAPALRNGLRVETSSNTGQIRTQTATHDGSDIVAQEAQTMVGTSGSMTLSDQGLSTDLRADSMTNTTHDMIFGMGEIAISAESMALSLVLPLLAGNGVQTAEVAIDLAAVNVDEALFGRMGVSNILAQPVNLSVVGQLRYEPLIDLIDVTRLMSTVDAGGTVLTLHDVGFDGLSLGYGEALLTGNGLFSWEGGMAPSEFMPPPQGGATLTMTGAYALLNRLGSANVLPPQAMLGARGILAAMGRPVGEDRLESVISVGSEGVRVNGAPIPF